MKNIRKFFNNEFENHRFNKMVDRLFKNDPKGWVEDLKFISELVKDKDKLKLLDSYIDMMGAGFCIHEDKIQFIKKSLIKKNIKFVIDDKNNKLYIPSIKQLIENEQFIKMLVDNM